LIFSAILNIYSFGNKPYSKKWIKKYLKGVKRGDRINFKLDNDVTIYNKSL